MLTRNEVNQLYKQKVLLAQKEGQGALQDLYRELGKRDLFFLLTVIFNRVDVDRDWLYERCTEVQMNPDGYLDLWFREGYKSTIITYGVTIQDILNNPSVTCGIFSYNRPTAKAFLRQIKREFEVNDLLKGLYPDILWANPNSEAPKWSEDEGIVVKRKVNPKESTVEAWGLVDGQPTGRHFSRMIYDDVVTLESVTTPEMCQKTIRAWEMSRNLMSEGGKTRYIGTRYHFNDAYGEIMRRDVVKPRIYPVYNKDMEPQLLSKERIEEKRKELGPYVFSCHGPGTKILMSDWSLRAIEDVKKGDFVVGWSMGPGKRSKLVPTEVLFTSSRPMDTVRITMEGGMKIDCTPDHKWWTGRRTTDRGRSIYSEINITNKTKGVSALCRAIDLRVLGDDPLYPFVSLTGTQRDYAAYLGGIYDGEGTVTSKCIQITQSEKKHPEVCEKIRQALDALKFEYNEFRAKGEIRDGIIHFCLTGGREERFRFLNLTNPAKRQQIAKSLYGARYFVGKETGKDFREKVIDIAPRAYGGYVYNLETTTGNYIANGYCSKNSQMLQNPVADEAQNFKEEWLQTWNVESVKNLKIYILVDPASKKKKNSDYTAMFVVGLGQDKNYYVIDMIRDRLNLTERMQTLLYLHKMYNPVTEVRGGVSVPTIVVGYEEYGMQADIEHLQYVMNQENYRFPVFPIGGNVAKEDRIRALVPIFEQKRVFLPRMCVRTLANGKTVDLTKVFIEEEYKSFPVGAHDDMLDALSRVLDHGKKGLFATFPECDMPRILVRPPKDITEVKNLELAAIMDEVNKSNEMERALYEW